jgi:hypothetical protein
MANKADEIKTFRRRRVDVQNFLHWKARETFENTVTSFKNNDLEGTGVGCCGSGCQLHVQAKYPPAN